MEIILLNKFDLHFIESINIVMSMEILTKPHVIPKNRNAYCLLFILVLEILNADKRQDEKIVGVKIKKIL